MCCFGHACLLLVSAPRATPHRGVLPDDPCVVALGQPVVHVRGAHSQLGFAGHSPGLCVTFYPCSRKRVLQGILFAFSPKIGWDLLTEFFPSLTT